MISKSMLALFFLLPFPLRLHSHLCFFLGSGSDFFSHVAYPSARISRISWKDTLRSVYTLRFRPVRLRLFGYVIDSSRQLALDVHYAYFKPSIFYCYRTYSIPSLHQSALASSYRYMSSA